MTEKAISRTNHCADGLNASPDQDNHQLAERKQQMVREEESMNMTQPSIHETLQEQTFCYSKDTDSINVLVEPWKLGRIQQHRNVFVMQQQTQTNVQCFIKVLQLSVHYNISQLKSR